MIVDGLSGIDLLQKKLARNGGLSGKTSYLCKKETIAMHILILIVARSSPTFTFNDPTNGEF